MTDAMSDCRCCERCGKSTPKQANYRGERLVLVFRHVVQLLMVILSLQCTLSVIDTVVEGID